MILFYTHLIKNENTIKASKNFISPYHFRDIAQGEMKFLIFTLFFLGAKACVGPPPPPPPPPSPPPPPPSPPSPPSSGCNCGVNPGNRIVGGVNAAKNELPWQVALTSSNSRTPFCGGTIVSKRCVVTAAHCVQGSSPGSMRAVVGEHNYGSSSGQRMEIQSITVHPGYSRNTCKIFIMFYMNWNI